VKAEAWDQSSPHRTGTSMATPDALHLTFSQPWEQYLFEWLKKHQESTPFSMSGLVKRMIINDYRRTKYANGRNLYPINVEATGF
jgi:hypothetical protein